jgi:hypothetical protein
MRCLVAHPTINYKPSKSTNHIIAHMNTFHAHDALHWAIQKHFDVKERARQMQSLRTNAADVHNALLCFVGCHFVVINACESLQAIGSYMPYLCLADTNLQRIQRCLLSRDTPLTPRRARESVLPRLYVNCKQQKSRDIDNKWPISVMADGCTRKDGVRFECLMGLSI